MKFLIASVLLVLGGASAAHAESVACEANARGFLQSEYGVALYAPAQVGLGPSGEYQAMFMAGSCFYSVTYADQACRTASSHDVVCIAM